MLPFCERRVSLPRIDVAPVWTRSFPIAKEPTTLGQHLKKKRFIAGLRQKESAVKLGVSARTLSLWECDRIDPSWDFQPRIAAYLGFDPFTEPALGKPKGNETHGIAFLLPEGTSSIAHKIKQFRLKSRKTRRQLAADWGVSTKTLWGWESDSWEPTLKDHKQLIERLESAGYPSPEQQRPAQGHPVEHAAVEDQRAAQGHIGHLHSAPFASKSVQNQSFLTVERGILSKLEP
jgi:DNA-binding XRE family transcriptional regulator